MESSSTCNSSSQLKTTNSSCNSSSQVKTTHDSSFNSCAPEKSPARKKLKEDIIKTDDNSDTKPDPKSTAKPEPEQTESKTSKVRAINNFFNKMSKEEYRKELKRSTVSAVLTVRALVHSPEPPLEPVASAPVPKNTAPVPSIKQRRKMQFCPKVINLCPKSLKLRQKVLILCPEELNLRQKVLNLRLKAPNLFL